MDGPSVHSLCRTEKENKEGIEESNWTQGQLPMEQLANRGAIAVGVYEGNHCH